MVDTASIWTAAAVGLLMLWLFLRTRLNYTAFAELKLDSATRANDDELDVTVIIPARNEERRIGDCVKSFPKSVRVIVMDDNSQDGTAQKAREAGAEVITAPPLKRNTMGKPAACFAAAEHVTTRYMLFVDADTGYKPEFLPTLIGYANAQSLAVVSLFLKRRHPNVLSALFMPYAYALYFAGVSAKGVHSLHLMETNRALANGQCILFSTSAYAFTGGHLKLINEVLDDIEIGRLAKRHRLKFQVMRAEKLGWGRMYESSLDAWRGFQKNTIRLLAYNWWATALSVVTAVTPFAYVPILMWLWSEREEDFVLQTFYAFAAIPFLPLLAWYKNPLGLLVPVISHVFPVFVATALLRSLLGTKDVWKGRKI